VSSSGWNWRGLGWLPGLTVLRRYRRSWLRGDLLAGITVTAYLVPQVMAYAQLVRLPPVTGLWAALPALVVYALLGSSRSLTFGPESSTALMTAVALGPLAAGNSARYAELASALALLVGLIALLAGLARLGFLADLLSRPVLVGYMAGLALIMIGTQLGKATGVPVTGETFEGDMVSFARHVGSVRLASLAMTLIVLALLLLLRWRWPALPGPLLAVLLATAAVAGLGLARHGIAVVGEIPRGLPRPALPALHASELRRLLLPAVSVVIVGFSDDLLTARSFARHGERISANRELVALGVANSGASLLSGFPVSASASSTAIAQAAGSRTQLYSLTAAASLLVVLSLARSVLAEFPLAALAAIVIYAAIRLIDLQAFRRLVAFRRSELVIALAAFAGVLLVGILYGVLLAVGISIAELLVRVARPHDAVLGLVPGLAGMHDVDDYPAAETVPGLVVYRYDAPLFFANAEDFRRRALAAARDHGPARWFVLNVEANVEVDFTALEAMDSLREELTRGGTVFALARVKQDLLDRLKAFGLAEKIGADLLFPTLPTMVAAYQEWAASQQATPDQPEHPSSRGS
jgi:high affinity sulfate transporter 1